MEVVYIAPHSIKTRRTREYGPALVRSFAVRLFIVHIRYRIRTFKRKCQ